MRAGAKELSLEGCLARHRDNRDRPALVVLASIGSTNQLAGEIARAYLEDDRLPPQLVLLARRQTNGRGRGDHRWVSPAGKGIYTSLLLSATDDDAVATLPLSVPVALCEALDGLGIGCTIKWPNDLMVGGRKLGGVLIEALAGSRTAIVGYGINGSQDEADLPAAEATSLRLATGAVPDLSRLAIDLARAVMKRVACSESLSAVVSDYRDRSLHRPGEPLRCRLGGEIVAGRFLGFDERGRLTLDTPEGERSLSSAELLLEGSAGDRMGRETAADGR